MSNEAFEGVTLNIYPTYEFERRARTKTSSVRWGDKSALYKAGMRVGLTCGWDAGTARFKEIVELTSVVVKPLNRVTAEDLKGECADLTRPEALRYVLGAIYKRLVFFNDNVTIIKWRYL